MSWEAVLLCSLLLSCAGTNEEAAASASAEGAQFTALLTAVNQTPDDTLQLCAGLTDAELYGECIVAGVEALPAAATSQAQEFCTAIDAQQAAVPRSECFFRVAERSLRPELCEQSQLFEEDCRMHLWTRSLRSSLPKQAAPGEVETDVSRRAAEFGFEVSDTRPWVALYRVLLGRMKPMKRSTCDAVSDSTVGTK